MTMYTGNRNYICKWDTMYPEYILVLKEKKKNNSKIKPNLKMSL